MPTSPRTSISLEEKAQYLFSAPYTHTGVQRLVQWIMDSQGISQFELSKRAGLSPAAVFQILNKTEKQVTRPSRKSTLSALAQAIGAEVRFDTPRKQFGLVQKFDLPSTNSKELTLLLSEIGNWVISRRRRITKEERDQILRVVKVLMT